MLLCILGILVGLRLGVLGVFCSFCCSSFRRSWYFIEGVVLKVFGDGCLGIQTFICVGILNF